MPRGGHARDRTLQGIVLATAMHIDDQLVGRSSFPVMANIDEYQARTFDTRESLRH